MKRWVMDTDDESEDFEFEQNSDIEFMNNEYFQKEYFPFIDAWTTIFNIYKHFISFLIQCIHILYNVIKCSIYRHL